MQIANCRADLSAVVSPGYTFASGERADTSKLNRLGNPTITISGTVGGTNANVANNSINGAMLVNGLPGSNLTWDASSPRSLVIKNQGVGTNQLKDEIAGLGLSSASGLLRVNVDTNTITITNDVVTLNLTTFSNLVNTLAAVTATNVALYAITNRTGTIAAWCKFDGTATGTHAVTAGVNVSNIVRTATGNYTVNFTNAMLTTNYAIQITIGATSAEQTWGVTAQTLSNFSIQVGRGSLSVEDRPWIYATVIQ